jgi:hypothetical protein
MRKRLQKIPHSKAANQATLGEAANLTTGGDAADPAARGDAANRTPGDQAPNQTGNGGAAAPADTKAAPAATDSTPQPAAKSGGSEKATAPGLRITRTDVKALGPELEKLVSTMLGEGSTVEDVVEAINERGGDRITLQAVQNYFQGNPKLQAQRVHNIVAGSDELLATIDKDPESALAQLARATFMTGYLRLHREAALITPKDAEHARLERLTQSLKRQLLVVQKGRAVLALKLMRAQTQLILLNQEKVREEIWKLQQQAKAHRPGEPMGPEMLERIQQLYGLASQPLLCEENAHAAKA